MEIIRELEPTFINKKKYKTVEVRCTCYQLFTTLLKDIVTGKVKHCGCKKKHEKHGLSAHRIYDTYQNIVARCYNEKNPSFKYYGAKGITVCAEWLNDPATFFEWAIVSDYEDDRFLEMKDGEYSPENCQWVERKKNLRNKFNNRRVKGKTLVEWNDYFKQRNPTLYGKIKEVGLIKTIYN